MRYCLLIAALLAPLSVHAEIVLSDDAGANLRLSAPAERVITLAPHLAELVFDVGAGDRLVGTVEWSDHPPAAREVPRIGDAYQLDIERIVALKPDVVLAWGGGTPEATIDRLRRLGLPVAVLTPDSLASIPHHLLWLGKLLGVEQRAQNRAEQFVAGLQQLRDTYSNASRVSVFYQISAQPLFTVGGGHVISELFRVCGGENIFSDLSAAAHAVGREAVIARDPQVIVAGRHEGSGNELLQWEQWPGMTAVAAGNVFAINAERIARPAAGLLEGGRELCRTLDHARENLQTKGVAAD